MRLELRVRVHPKRSQKHPLSIQHIHTHNDWQQSISGLLTVPLLPDDAILCNNCKSMPWHVKNGNGAFVCHVYYNIPILFYACNSSISIYVCVCVCTFCDCVCIFVINLMINRLLEIYWVFAWHRQAATAAATIQPIGFGIAYIYI